MIRGMWFKQLPIFYVSYREGCQIWNRMYDLFLFQGRNSLFDFQYVIDEHLPVHICTKPKKKRAYLGQTGAELELHTLIFLRSMIYIDTFIVLNGIILYFCTSLSKKRSYCWNPYVLT